MLGPAYGGAIIEIWNWRGIFWLNVPQAAVIAVALLFLPNQRFAGSRMDYRGAIVLTLALVLLSLAVAHEGLFRLSSWVPYWLLVGFLVSSGALVVMQRRTVQPLLSGTLFRAWAFVTANVAQLLVGIALIIAMAAMVIMANTVMDVPEAPGGLADGGLVAAADDGNHSGVFGGRRAAAALGGCPLDNYAGAGAHCRGDVPGRRLAHPGAARLAD